MDYILDTHACLWAFGDYKKVSSRAKSILEDDKAKIFVSHISLLEIAIKKNIGKLVDLEIPIPEFIELIKANRIEILPVKDEHIIAYAVFDFDKEHRDPFDRYLIATTYREQKTIITCDEKFSLYSDRITIIW